MRAIAGVVVVLVGCGGSGSSEPSDRMCREIGNQPPCCEFFGHRETPEGLCEEGLVGFDSGLPDTSMPDAASPDAGADSGLSTCEDNVECTGEGTPQCCPGGACTLDVCITGPAPPPPCEFREESCGNEMVCVNDATCGWGFCQRDCRLDGNCAELGLTCEDEICTFDCTSVGCAAGEVCRENGQCGVAACDETSCGPAADCTPVSASQFSHRDSGCRPKACNTTSDCPSGTFCINGTCNEAPGMCGDATPPP